MKVRLITLSGILAVKPVNIVLIITIIVVVVVVEFVIIIIAITTIAFIIIIDIAIIKDIDVIINIFIISVTIAVINIISGNDKKYHRITIVINIIINDVITATKALCLMTTSVSNIYNNTNASFSYLHQ